MYWARRRPGVREAPAAHIAGERRLAFFRLRRSTPINVRFPMSATVFLVPFRQVRRARPALPSRLQAHPFRRRGRRASAPRVALAVPMPPRVVVAGWQQAGLGGAVMATYRTIRMAFWSDPYTKP